MKGFNCHTRKSLYDSIDEINQKLNPNFKFSQIDLEEIHQLLAKRRENYMREPTQDFLIKLKKEQRRKEY